MAPSSSPPATPDPLPIPPLPVADWYFDYVSPFAYLQCAIHRDLFRNWGALRLRPVVFGGLLDRNGQRGPAEIPSKRRFTYDHVQWLARRHGVTMRFPPRHPLLSLGALRLTVALGATLEVVLETFDFIWAAGNAVDTPEGLLALAKHLGAEEAVTRAQSPEVKRALRDHFDDAVSAGVFGVPTFVVKGEIFWGLDATEMVTDFLAAPDAGDPVERARVRALPMGAERKALVDAPK